MNSMTECFCASNSYERQAQCGSNFEDCCIKRQLFSSVISGTSLMCEHVATNNIASDLSANNIVSKTPSSSATNINEVYIESVGKELPQTPSILNDLDSENPAFLVALFRFLEKIDEDNDSDSSFESAESEFHGFNHDALQNVDETVISRIQLNLQAHVIPSILSSENPVSSVESNMILKEIDDDVASDNLLQNAGSVLTNDTQRKENVDETLKPLLSELGVISWKPFPTASIANAELLQVHNFTMNEESGSSRVKKLHREEISLEKEWIKEKQLDDDKDYLPNLIESGIVSIEEALNLFRMASKYNNSKLMESCHDFLFSKLNEQNCLFFLRKCQHMRNTFLYKESLNFLMISFEEICLTQQWIQFRESENSLYLLILSDLVGNGLNPAAITWSLEVTNYEETEMEYFAVNSDDDG